jgi:hypothetical protein
VSARHEVDVAVLSPNSRMIVALAKMTGWALTQNHSKSLVALRSPDGTVQVNVPAGSLNYNRSKSILGKVLRATPMANLVRLYRGSDDMRADPEAAQVVATLGVDLHQWMEREDAKDAAHLDRLTEEVQQGVEKAVHDYVEEMQELAERAAVERARLERGPEPEPPPDGVFVCPECGREFTRSVWLGAHRWRAHGVEGQSERTLADRRRKQKAEARVAAVKDPGGLEEIARQPWTAHRGGRSGGSGRMYPSPVVDEVTLLGGVVVYGCRFCDRVAAKPASIARHAAQAHKDRKHGPPQTFPVPVYEPTDQHRRPSSRLRSDVLMALDLIEGWREMDAEALSLRIAEVIAENKPDAAPPVPLTDAEVLARIVALVDRGQYAELQSSLHRLQTEVEAKAEALAQAQEEVSEVRTEAERLRSERQALRELLS